MTAPSYSFSAEVWEWDAKKSWTFVSIPEDVADDIEERFGRSAAGFGSIRVEVTVGDTVWRTSLFPSTEEKTYVLPVKKVVRTAEGLETALATGLFKNRWIQLAVEATGAHENEIVLVPKGSPVGGLLARQTRLGLGVPRKAVHAQAHARRSQPQSDPKHQASREAFS